MSQNSSFSLSPQSVSQLLTGDSVAPMLGQAHRFRGYAGHPIPYAIERYTNEATRLYKVINERLADRPFIAGDYSIADMAIYPWLRSWERQGQNLNDHPHLKRWYETIEARPAVQRGLNVLADKRRTTVTLSTEERAIMFNERQVARR